MTPDPSTATLPHQWTWKKLKHVARMAAGDAITSEDIRETGDYPVYGGNGLRGYTDQFNRKGDFVLIGRQGALCGNINYASGEFWASEHAIVADLQDDAEVRWLGELLSYMNLNQYSQSAAQPGIAVDVIANLPIPVPPRTARIWLCSRRRIWRTARWPAPSGRIGCRTASTATGSTTTETGRREPAVSGCSRCAR